MSRRLVVDDGQRERELLLVANMVVGRDPMCDISDDNDLLSRRHAEFVVRGDSVSVRDLGSRNGVYVNGRRTADGRLRPDDQVQIGNLKLRFVEDDAPLPTEVEDDDPNRTVLWQPDEDLLGVDSVGQAVSVAEAGGLARAPAGSWSAFVFTRVTILSAIISAAFIAVIVIGRGGNAVWLGVPLLVALVATYVVGAVIDRRIDRALTALNEDLERAERGSLDQVADPLGAKATQELAATVNRLLAKGRTAAAQPAESR